MRANNLHQISTLKYGLLCSEELQSVVMDDVAVIKTSQGQHIINAMSRKVLSETHRFAVTIHTNMAAMHRSSTITGDESDENEQNKVRVLVLAAKTATEAVKWVETIKAAIQQAVSEIYPQPRSDSFSAKQFALKLL